MNEPLPDALKNRCKCSHSSFQHQYAELDGPCSKPDCDCKAYAPVTVETVEPPEPEHRCNGCGHTEGEGCGCSAHEYVDPEHCDRCAEVPTAPCGRPASLEPQCSAGDWCCKGAAPIPPQPERRPPLRVAYSVAGGHAYEVCVPGDVSVTAQDGALIITHPEAQVLAIMRVAPFKES
ncbi:hypothetical protein [Streptomyces cinereoruber]|uniref:hypothetical protein n=1 Tax=Streptomyces cinereoruber TaxID=67260 RepID=UPI003C2E2427